MKAFTLIEAVVVTSIIFLITLVVLLNYGAESYQFNLQRTTNKLAQDIGKARDWAMNTKEFKGEIPPGGYGVYIQLSESDTSYKIYADLNGNEQHDDSDGIVEVGNLEKGIFIKNISPSPLSINFLAPDPKVTISGGADSATIELAIESNLNEIKTIIVNKLGLITIE